MNISYKEIEKYEYISFDLFDTLAFRSFSTPEKVFFYMEEVLRQMHSNYAKDFAKKRLKAESKARRLNNWKEVTLEQIYEQFPTDSQSRVKLVNLESSIEASNIMPNKEVTDLFNECIEKGKHVFIITDMYLPRRCIFSIINKIKVAPEKVYISSEVGKTKESGELYKYVLDDLDIKPEQIIHIGDNEISDYKNPLGIGINSIKYTRTATSFSYLQKNNSIQMNHLNSVVVNGFATEDNEYSGFYKIGYSVMGPVIYEFCRWIHQMKEDKKLDKLFFASREGYAILRVYQTLYPEDKDTIKYVRLNKNLLRLPLLEEDSAADLIIRSSKNRNVTSWAEIGELFGITDIIRKEYPTLDLNKKINLYKLNDSEKTELSSKVWKVTAPQAKKQRELLAKYLEGFNVSGKRVGLVNNSYSGNSQKLLEKAVSKIGYQVSFYGLQIGANNRCKSNLGDRYNAWLGNTMDTYLFERGSLIFEHLLFEPAGTSVIFKDGAKDSKVDVVCSEPVTEVNSFSKIEMAQRGMVSYAQACHNTVELLPPCSSIGFFVNLIQSPTFEDANLLSGLDDDDYDGNRKINNLAYPFSTNILWRKDIYNSISWIQGYLKANKKPDIYRELFNFRLYVTYIMKRIKGNE